MLQDGYNIDSSLDEMIARLKERFFHKTEFPHEIGLFLGYPIEDVKGFRKFGGSDCKMCGYWKVYDDVEQARRIFDSYDKCQRVYCSADPCGVFDFAGCWYEASLYISDVRII